jgi:hypothetical protein
MIISNCPCPFGFFGVFLIVRLPFGDRMMGKDYLMYRNFYNRLRIQGFFGVSEFAPKME